jgi:hypothetical protein
MPMAALPVPRHTCDMCRECAHEPVTRCGRCSVGLCNLHVPGRGHRCVRCEAEWSDDGRARRALQHMFAPPAFVLAAGITFGLLLPVLFALPFTVGATLVAAIATSVGFGAAVGTCRLVESTARAQFLREHARTLPEARVIRYRPRALPGPAPR